MELENKVRWGIIGCGDVCEVKSGPAFSKVKNSELVAVMRRNASKAADFARRHNVLKFYTDANVIIEDEEINAIYIATPPAFHEEYATLAMKSGKPVYIEKPVTLTASSCSRLIELSDEFSTSAVVAHYRRELPLFRQIKEILEKGQLGKIHSVTLRLFQSVNKNIIARSDQNWRIVPSLSGGGLFHDLAPHQLDILIWLFGRPGSTNGYSKNNGALYDAPDFVYINALFSGEISFEGTWNFNVRDEQVEDFCEIVGNNGKLTFSFFRDPMLNWFHDNRTQKMQFDIPKHIQEPMIDKVVKFFLGKADNPCSLQEALISMQIMDSAGKNS